MVQVNISDTESQLVALVERGEAFVIAKAGRPLAKVIPYALPQALPRQDVSKRVGFLAGKIQVPDDFDTMLADEIVEMFEGSTE